jgi:Tol biopolymer transport system component
VLNLGACIGPYEIVGRLGAGGMGEVYRGRDPRLERDVAIKILPSAFATDRDRVARFEREARTLATLNHPHIAQIYGVEGSDAGRALVMELVEGETLADRLVRGPFPLDEAVPIARQIAEALEAAHEAGIIHRDLKPANVKLRPDGSVKVLDFGLAKATESAADAVSNSALNAPTVTSPAMTHPGVILGTASYMSPEQARGRPVDRRADIWAFGCVLVELLTGRPLFAADTVTETLARIIEREPDLSGLPPGTPVAVRSLIARTLQRDPKQRLRDIGEARLTLETPLAVAQHETRARTPRARTIALMVFAMAALAAPMTAWLLRTIEGAPRLAPRRLALATPNGAPAILASVAPDASAILVVADDKLWLQQLDSFAATEVPGGDGARAPFWSPDSASFGFQTRGQLWRVSRTGGTPTSIGRVPDFTVSGGAAWLPDGRVVFTTGGSGLLQIPSTGGEPKPLFELDPAKEEDVHSLAASPDGNSLLYVLHPVRGNWSVELFDLRGSSRHPLYTGPNTSVHYPVPSSAGYVLFEQRAGVWALPVSFSDRRATGDPFLVASGARQPTIATNGTLVMPANVASGADTGLALIDRAGRTVRTIVEPRGSSIRDPRVSPDGRMAVVATRGPQGDSDLWIYGLEQRSERRLTFDTTVDASPVWSSDGQHIVYRCGEAICAIRADGAGSRVQLVDSSAVDPTVSPDRKLLVFAREVKPGDFDIFGVDLGNGGLSRPVPSPPRVLASGPRAQRAPTVSPDGRYLAYASAESGPMQVYISQLSGGAGKWQVPLGYAHFSRWSAKGDRVYVLDELDRIVEFPIDRTRLFDIGPPTARIPGTQALRGGWDRSGDPTQFLVPIGPASALTASRLLVVEHWRPEPR